MKMFRFLAAFALLALSTSAHAQTANKQPVFAQNQQWADLGNGPLDVQSVEGAGFIYSSGGAGVGTSAGTTALTLTATPPAGTAPCIGCVITCSLSNTAACTIPANTTVTAFNGTTGVTTSVATTVTAASLVWGAACPAATAANVPGVNPNTVASLGPPLTLRSGAGVPVTYPFSTAARLCAYAGQQAGFEFLTFPIGAH